MSDSKRRYGAIRKSLNGIYPSAPTGTLARHLNVLAAMINGIIGSQSTNLPAISGKCALQAVPESRVKRFYRWLQDDVVELETYFLPFAEALIHSFLPTPLVLVIDGSVAGRGCVALVIGLVYKQRALPIAWIVARGKKGHFAEAVHIALIEKVKALIPPGATVTLLGDGEFDGISLQAVVSGWKWRYVCRTAKNILLYWRKEQFCFQDMGEAIRAGEMMDVPKSYVTEKRHGPVTAIAWWGKGYKEPLYLITNMESAQEACFLYKKRFVIETFFSDQKSRGFFLDKSHLSDPLRLSRLMIAACLAYYWICYLGAVALENGWLRFIHRTHRCDLSLFQLGLRLLDYLIEHNWPLPEKLHWKEF